MDNLKGLLGIKRINRIREARVRKLCGVKKLGEMKELMKMFFGCSAILEK